VLAARTITRFEWAIYSFNNGHFVSSIQAQALPFRVVLCADAFVEGRALFKEFTNCPLILSGVKELYDHVRRSGDRSKLDGYLLHSHRFAQSSATHNFWQLQASLITELRNIRYLSMFVVFVHPDHDGRPVSLSIKSLCSLHWVISDTKLSFPTFGDSVASGSRLLIGVHSDTDSSVDECCIPTPPFRQPAPLAFYLWPSFNVASYAVSRAPSSSKFNEDLHINDPLVPHCERKDPVADESLPLTVQSHTDYCLHCHGADTSIQRGSEVVSINHLCPPFAAGSAANLFGHYFGIEYRDLTYWLSHKSNEFYLDAAIPAFTSISVLQSCHQRLVSIRDANLQFYEPNTIHAPAALANVFVNGSTTTRLPDRNACVKAYQADPSTRLFLDLIRDPSLITPTTLKSVHHSLRMPLRESLLVIENDMIILREPIGDGSSSYCRLRLVPESLRTILFVAFHASPIGGHLNYVRTFRSIHLRYFWPGMFQFIKDLCLKCPGCALANRTHHPKSTLVYSFPITAPMMVLHVDSYNAGAHASFEGDKTYVVAVCGMTSFAVMEPAHSNYAKGFAAVLMHILLHFGIFHTVVLDRASAFFGVLEQVVDLLKLRILTPSLVKTTMLCKSSASFGTLTNASKS
jgi:hypothetical protein